MICTWKDCGEKATHPQKDRDGNVWAELCEKHHIELDDSIGCPDIKKMMRNWILASGGA